MTIQELLVNVARAGKAPSRTDAGNGGDNYQKLENGDVAFLYQMICTTDEFNNLAGSEFAEHYDALSMLSYVNQIANTDETPLTEPIVIPHCEGRDITYFGAVIKNGTDEIWAYMKAPEEYHAVKDAIAEL